MNRTKTFNTIVGGIEIRGVKVGTLGFPFLYQGRIYGITNSHVAGTKKDMPIYQNRGGRQIGYIWKDTLPELDMAIFRITEPVKFEVADLGRLGRIEEPYEGMICKGVGRVEIGEAAKVLNSYDFKSPEKGLIHMRTLDGIDSIDLDIADPGSSGSGWFHKSTLWNPTILHFQGQDSSNTATGHNLYRSLPLWGINPDEIVFPEGTWIDDNGARLIDKQPKETTMYKLMLSKSPDRSEAIYLEGQTVSGDIYVFLQPDDNVATCQFRINGKRVTEYRSPFDLGRTKNTTEAHPFDTKTLEEGENIVTAQITDKSGTITSISSKFWVDNEGKLPKEEPAIIVTPGLNVFINGVKYIPEQ